MSKSVDKYNIKSLEKRLMADMGFSDKKAQIYISLLELGEVTASNIAESTGIKRTTVYNIMPELLHEGLVHKYRDKKKTKFFIEDTRELVARLEEKKTGILDIIPELNKLQFTKTIRPHIIQYEGIKGIIQLYRDMIDSIDEGGELLSILSVNYVKDIMPYHVLEHYSALRLKKKITHRIISTNNELIHEIKNKDKDELREIRIISEGSELIGSDIRIFGNKVAMLSFKNGFIGTIIESDDLYKLNKIIFERVWKTLEN